MSADRDHDANGGNAFARCENCGTALQGGYCHVCGQRAHNPLKHLGHAIEDVFESFWHLDGRIFRTLRDLFVPGRVAANYLGGHRVRYVAPLRLFVILTLLTFFVAHFTVSLERPNVSVGGDTPFAKAASAAEVQALREKMTREIRAELRQNGDNPAGAIAADIAIAELDRLAERRLHELRGDATTARKRAPIQERATDESRDRENDALNIQFGDDNWNPRTDVATVPFLPDFANEWLTKQARRGAANADRIAQDPEAFKDAWLRAVPTMLFLMVPVFALLLRLFYLFTPRSYLEHLVVALYSHAWLMLAVLGLLLLGALGDTIRNSAAQIAITIAELLLGVWMPLYLLLMQKRVYAQGWLLTSAKYVVLGTIHTILVSFAVLFALAVGVVRM